MSGFTLFHVMLSLLTIVSGLAVVYSFLTVRRYDGWTFVFLLTTIATLVTGFLFPFHGFTPAIGVGIVCVAIVIPVVLARYAFRMAGLWRSVFIVGSLLLLYFNCLVLIVQSFQKVPALNALAPTGSEPPIVIAQSALLLIFLIVGFLSLRRFRPLIAGF